MASREIPIDVPPDYEASFRNRRESESYSNIPCDAYRKTSQRRHSEFPNSKQPWTRSSLESPSYSDHQGLTRRGSMPVYLDRPRATRDRFDEIVEKVLTEKDVNLLEGIMDDFRPFHNQDFDNEEMGHPTVHRRPSAPISRRPFAMNSTKKDTTDIEIPVQICKNDDNLKHTSSSVQNVENDIKTREGTEHACEGTMTNNPKMKEEAVQTDEGIVILITEDNTKNTSQPLLKETQDKKDTEIIEGSAEKENGDFDKLSCIKKIEECFKETHEKVAAFEEMEKDTDREYMQLEESLMKTLMSLDAVEANGSKCVREARRSVVIQVQDDLKQLESKRQQK